MSKFAMLPVLTADEKISRYYTLSFFSFSLLNSMESDANADHVMIITMLETLITMVIH